MTDNSQSKSESSEKQEKAADMDPQQKKIEELQALVEKHKNDYLYLRAEFDNYKKHVIKERAETLKYGAERVLLDVLGVLDNFERALENKPTPETLSNYVKGVEMTAQELRSNLQKHGISEVPCQGVAFDPSVHEALSSEESKDVPPGYVSRVFKKPYKLHDKLIRPAQVVVAKAPTNS
ncbi:MAG: nucleotide exchange factor GrpE [Oligoflexia bacterium]|nr:MAG: nucleotide exchange factor GrpE [Oligoflexia bacterium]